MKNVVKSSKIKKPAKVKKATVRIPKVKAPAKKKPGFMGGM
jgi:hypothetical protein